MNLISKIKNNKTLVNGSLFSLFSFFNQGVSFVLLIILANFIAPAEYGQLSLFNTVVMFIGYFVVLSSDGFLSISYFKTSKEDFSKDVSAILCILLIMSLFIMTIIILGGSKLACSLKISQPLLFTALAISALQVVVNINLNTRRIKEDLKSYGALSCGFAFLNFVLSLALVIEANLNWLGRIYAQIICLIVFGTIALVSFKKENYYTIQIRTSRVKEIIFWGVPLIPHLATTWLRQGCDRYIIDANYSLAEVGLFSFALNLSNVIEMVGQSFNATNSVNIYKKLSDNKLSAIEKLSTLKKGTNEMYLIYIIATSIIILGASIMIPIVMPKYSAAIPYFYILSAYGFLRCIYYIYCNYLFYWNKNKLLMIITISSAILHVLLSLLLTKHSLLLTCTVYCITQFMVDIVIITYSKHLVSVNIK